MPVIAPSTPPRAGLAAALAARRQWTWRAAWGWAISALRSPPGLFKRRLDREHPALYASLEAFLRTDGPFPGGHATHAAACALGLRLLAARFRPRWRAAAGMLVAGLWIGLALAVMRPPRTGGGAA